MGINRDLNAAAGRGENKPPQEISGRFRPFRAGMSELVTAGWLGQKASELPVSPPTSPGEEWEGGGEQKQESAGVRKKVRTGRVLCLYTVGRVSGDHKGSVYVVLGCLFRWCAVSCGELEGDSLLDMRWAVLSDRVRRHGSGRRGTARGRSVRRWRSSRTGSARRG